MTDLIITERENLVAIADAVRSNIGESKEITIGEIVEGINYLGSNVSLDTSDATATSSDILNGKTAYVDGKKVTGNIATKTSSDLTASGATVTVPAGYYDSQATKSVSTATQATPSITINSNGFIVASATQTAGYVNAGTKTTTKQLTAQPAKTVTPSTSSQTAVASGVYTTGAVTVAGDTNLVAENIAEGKTIFGVTGTHSGGNGGIDTSDATASADEIMSGETAYVNGSKVTGTMPNNGIITSTMDGIDVKSVTIPEGYTSGGTVSLTDDIDTEVDSQANLIAQIIDVVSGKASNDGENTEIILQDKTVTPATSSQTVTADSGYDGLRSVMVTGDANLVAENIVSGKSIFGIIGNAEIGTGGSASNYENEILDGSLVNYTNSTVKELRNAAFMDCTSLKTVNFTACEHIGQEAFVNCTSLTTASFENCLSMASSAFQGCTKLTTISFPACKSIYWAGFSSCYSLASVNLPSCTYIGGRAFQKCSKLANLSLPVCRQIYSSAFQSCSALTTVSLPAATLIGSTAFGSCTKLNTFYLAGSSLCGLSGSNAFTGTGITSTSGSIYVNASLVDSYKEATNWAYFSNVIYAIE